MGKLDSQSQLNSLRYTVVDDSGNAIREVVDYEMDGQADFRVHYAPPAYAEIWHADRWLRIERSGNVRGVHINGQFKSVKSKDGRLYVEVP